MGTGLVLWGLSVGAAAIVGSYKGRAGLGVLLGILAGPIGIVIIACIPATDQIKVERIRKRRQLEAMADLPPARHRTTEDVERYYQQTAGEKPA